MADAAKILATVKRVISSNGQSVTLIVTNHAAYDTGRGEFLSSTPVESTLRAVVTKVKESLVDGNSVLATDLSCMLAAEGTKPVVGNRVLIAGMQYTVLDVATTVVQDTDVAWTLQLRR